MTYLDFLKTLEAYREEGFASFQRKLIFTKRKILGVRTPVMRKLAKELEGSVEELLSYPDEYYEVVFIKLTAVSNLPYEDFLKHLPACIELMDNWALCDCFKAKCLQGRKEEFLKVLEELFARGGEYFERYVLVTLLSYCDEAKYLSTIKRYALLADTSYYYVHMAVAWLCAELLIKQYDEGVRLLQEGNLPPKTHNKAIQKAIESYRVALERKEYLRSLKK